MKFSPANRAALGFGLALFLLVAIVSTSFWTTARLKDSARSAAHALQAVNAANDLHTRIEIPKIGVGAYLATGDFRHLLRRRNDIEAAGRAVTVLRALNPGDPGLQSRLDAINSLLRHEAELHERMIARRELHKISRSDLLDWHEDVERVLWQCHRKIDDEIEAVDRARLADSVAHARGFASFAMIVNGLGGFVGFAIVISAAIITVRDVRARSRVEGQLEYQASHDALTGLPNRTLLQRYLEQNISSSRANGSSFALLLIDLDRFKQINDTFGHHYGDIVLQQMNPRLRAALRGTDFVARLGGDEFAILLPGASREAASTIAEWILIGLGRPIDVDGHRLEVGASIGIALFPEHGDDATVLLQRADLAMYAAKRFPGGHAVSVAEPIASPLELPRAQHRAIPSAPRRVAPAGPAAQDRSQEPIVR